MPTRLNRNAYQRLVDEDLAWLDSIDADAPGKLEREHVRAIVHDSARSYFGVVNDVDVEIEHARALGFDERHDDAHTIAELLQLVIEQLKRASRPRAVDDRDHGDSGEADAGEPVFLLPVVRRYLVRVAATAIATIESIDRRVAAGTQEAR